MFIKLYNFNELSKQAKQAFYNSRDFSIYEEQTREYIFDDFLESLKKYSFLLDINVSLGDISGDSDILNLKGGRAVAYIVNKVQLKSLEYTFYNAIYKPMFNKLSLVHSNYSGCSFPVNVTKGYKRKEVRCTADFTVTSKSHYVDHYETGVYTDEAFLSAFDKFVNMLKKNKNYTLQDFCEVWQEECNIIAQDEVAGALQESAVSEYFNCNGYMFTKSGKLIFVEDETGV